MHVLFLGGVFDDSHNEEIVSKTRTYVEYAANNFQKKIINGLKENGIEPEVISAPFLGSYPNAYSDLFFKGFNRKTIDISGYKYVHFLNLWGIRNFSRANSLKRAVKEFICSKDRAKLIIVYTSHTPLIQAANYAKRKDPNIRICLVVPDLPQYMNLADNVSKAYKILKKYDVKAFLKENRTVDSYVVLTKHMVNSLEVGNRPFEVIEGIYQSSSNWGEKKEDSCVKKIVYTGKLDRSFGIMNLVNAFMQIGNDNIRLLICGSGEERNNVEIAAQRDPRIMYMGQVTSDQARKIIVEGDILVNPRQNNSEYTKYSFPSKIIDYLATGNPVIAYKLDGMPDQYEQFIEFVTDDSIEALQKSIEKVLSMDSNEIVERANKAMRYLSNVISEKEVAKKIIKIGLGQNKKA